MRSSLENNNRAYRFPATRCLRISVQDNIISVFAAFHMLGESKFGRLLRWQMMCSATRNDHVEKGGLDPD